MKSWEPFRSCLLNSTANLAHFHQNWAGLAVLFRRQIPNGSQDFYFLFNILIFIYFFKYETIETHARAFLTLNILAIGRVPYFYWTKKVLWQFDRVVGIDLKIEYNRALSTFFLKITKTFIIWKKISVQVN